MGLWRQVITYRSKGQISSGIYLPDMLAQHNEYLRIQHTPSSIRLARLHPCGCGSMHNLVQVKVVLQPPLSTAFNTRRRKAQKNIIYFFCRFDEPEKCKAISALRSLTIQALKLLRYIPDVYELYKDECSVVDCYVASLAIAERVLGYLLKRIDYASVVVDGLDKCRESAILNPQIRLREQEVHYYADALPSRIHEYDSEGDDLVWGYHM